ncbi:MAG: PD-(D/E)XK nuclease family protein [Candidatus Nanoarchaeia archaeon]|nr:PD-(D/E)XK nuclease family protein [Candidatus Nanoarchaeia archaeon]
MVIQQISLDHPGGFYHYRVHNLKANQLCNGVSPFKPLKNYLENMFSACPNNLFGNGPRSSALKFPLEDVNVIEIIGHEISELARIGLEANKERYKTAHSQVQVFMLENDKNTIAMEVPIWLNHLEMENYQQIFDTKNSLTGHIDVLRIEGDKVWVWDYKPKANKEKYASTQVYFYALMLSKRTGIPLEHFRCGYFDDTYAYMFKPRVNKWNGASKLSSFF